MDAKMKKMSSTSLRLAILIYIFMIAASLAFGQNAQLRKMVTDDTEAAFKADTSIVVINDTAYQKVVSVNYRVISESSLKSEFQAKAEQVRSRMEQLREERERTNTELEELKAQLEAERTFYKLAAKELKFASKNADDPEPPGKAELERQKLLNRIDAYKKNPRAPK